MKITIEPHDGVRDFINTPVGNIRVYICSDFIDEKNIEIFLKGKNTKKYDIVCVISCQKDPEGNTKEQKRHYHYADYISKELKSKPYVIFANTKCGHYASGKSAIFFESLERKDRETLCNNKELLKQYSSFVSVVPDDSRYMLAHLKLKNRNPQGFRKVGQKKDSFCEDRHFYV